MKHGRNVSVVVAGLVGLLAWGGCGRSSRSKGEQKKSAPSAGAMGAKRAAPARKGPRIPTMKLDPASWVETNLEKTARRVGVTLKLPKDAKVKKNPNGNAEIRLSRFYQLTVAYLAVDGRKGAKAWGEAHYKHSSYKNLKKLVDDPDGFVFTRQMKDEANGTRYQPEAHFVRFLIGKEKGEEIVYVIYDGRPLDNYFLPGSTYSEALAKKVYAIVKASARVNKPGK